MGFDQPPYYINIVLGTHKLMSGATAYTPKNLQRFVEDLPENSLFCVSGIGPAQLPSSVHSLILGRSGAGRSRGQRLLLTGTTGHQRELVERMVRILHELNLEPATPAEAREMLGLPQLGHRLMSLRYALLGNADDRAASGYRLAQEFGESAGWFWYASHSQIHPELKRMEDEGSSSARCSMTTAAANVCTRSPAPAGNNSTTGSPRSHGIRPGSRCRTHPAHLLGPATPRGDPQALRSSPRTTTSACWMCTPNNYARSTRERSPGCASGWRPSPRPPTSTSPGSRPSPYKET